MGAALALAATSAPPAEAQWLFGGSSSLDNIEERLARKHVDIDHIDAEELAGFGQAGEDYILLDVREPSEYAVSRIPGALQIDPGASADDVRAMIANADEDKPLILYCSVGRRSSELGSRVAGDLTDRQIVNLRGGVFAWHNEARTLENAAGTTDYVHPYNNWWKRLLERGELAAKQPQTD